MVINCPLNLSCTFKASKFQPKFKSPAKICPQIRCTLEHTVRRSANYHPSLWTDEYIQSLPTSSSMDEQNNERIEMLKKEVVKLIHENKDVKSQLRLIDELEQLGVAYHFEDDIHDSLSTVSALSSENLRMALKDDLYATGLAFRLLRQHGFDVSQGLFIGFTDEKGEFIPSVKKDIKGILSLYEASYLAKHNERLMDKANLFSTLQLRHLLEGSFHHDHYIREYIEYALELPLDWRMKRLHNRWFIESRKGAELMNPVLHKLAILDYNATQITLKKEIKLLSRWWNKLGLAEKLPFARDRIMENYFWSVGITSNPQHENFREASTKAFCLIVFIDDVYDVYGTFDELELFSGVINRWDVHAANQLPEYMQACFFAIFDAINDASYKVMKQKGLDVTPHLKKAWAELSNSYFVEAKWYHRGYKPKLDEYLDNGWMSISGPLLAIIAKSLSEHLTKEDLVSFNYPKLTKYTSTIIRLCDDLATAKDEFERGDVLKSLQCYMHTHGVPEVIARHHIKEIIKDNWRHINAKRNYSNLHQKFYNDMAINFSRMAHCYYQYGDGYGKSNKETKERITSVLIEPIHDI